MCIRDRVSSDQDLKAVRTLDRASAPGPSGCRVARLVLFVSSLLLCLLLPFEMLSLFINGLVLRKGRLDQRLIIGNAFLGFHVGSLSCGFAPFFMWLCALEVSPSGWAEGLAWCSSILALLSAFTFVLCPQT